MGSGDPAGVGQYDRRQRRYRCLPALVSFRWPGREVDQGVTERPFETAPPPLIPMNKIFRAGFFALAAGLTPLGAVSQGLAAEPIKIVAFGDSTTAPRLDLVLYATLLEQELNRRLPIPVQMINAGVRGDTTDAAALRLERDVLAHEPAVVIIQFGINDSAVDVWKTPPATEPRVPLDRFRQNLQHFIEVLQDRGATVVLMTPNPLAWTPALQKQYGKPPYNPQDPDGFNRTLNAYTKAVREIAAAMQVPLVDVSKAHATHARISPEPLLLDGIHPNGEGHRLVARLLIDLFTTHRLLRELSHEPQ